MPSELFGQPIFYEDFSPDRPSRFDADLDEFSKLSALEKQELKGFCNISGVATTFTLRSENFREDLVADVSQSINRHRQVICALSLSLFGSPNFSLAEIVVYINEKQLRVYSADAYSPMFLFLKAQLDPALFVYSEYFGREYKSGEMVNDIRHEDLQATSFADESFDIILTCDVFEHIPNAIIAEREVVRILKANGIYCFTVPYIPDGDSDLILAEAAGDGEIQYFAEPQYHGDPVRPDEGILVYRLFSFRDLKQRFEALGCTFRSYRFWSKALGIIDANGWVQIAIKETEENLSLAPYLVGSRWLRELQNELSSTQAQVVQGASEITRLTASIDEACLQLTNQQEVLTRQQELITTQQDKLTREEDELTKQQDVLAKRQEVLTWMQNSRSWRLATVFQDLWQFQDRLRALAARMQYKLGLGGTIFYGAIEGPTSDAVIGEQLEVSGWVFSTAAPVVFVEAFLDSDYLGRLEYGKERDDVAKKYSAEGAEKSGYAQRFLLSAEQRGKRRLRLRAFDALGHSQLFSRPLHKAPPTLPAR